MKLRSHLVGLAVVTGLPLFVFSGVLIVQLSRQEHAAREQGLRETTRALALAVDRELRVSIIALQALGTSEDLRLGHLAAFSQEAEHLLRAQPFWHAILLLDPSGGQVMDLARPPGGSPPSFADRPFFQEVLRTSRPAISDLVALPAIGVTYVVVAVPVIVDSRVRSVLAAAILPSAWGALLAEQRVAPETTASVLDRQKIILARSRKPEEFVGHPATPDVAAATRDAAEGWARLVTKEGTVTYAAFSRSALSGWTVVIGTPAAPIDAAIRRSLVAMCTAGGIVLTMAAVAATVLSRRITRSVLAISRSAVALGRGEPMIGSASSGVAEVEGMARALQAASRVLQEREHERDELLAVEHSARREAQASLARLERLQGIIDVMLSHFGLEDLLPRLLGRLRAALRADAATVLLLDEAGTHLRVLAADGIGAAEVADLSVPVTQGLAGRIASAGRTMTFEDVAGEQMVRPAMRETVRSLLGTPLRAGDRLIGVVHVGSVERRRFSEEDVQLLRLVADRLALAIRHAELDDMAHRAHVAVEAASQERDRFFAAVSHELRTPLAAIRSWANVLTATQPANEPTARAVAAIERNAEVLTRLSDDLTELSRTLAGKIRLQLRVLRLLPLLRDVVDTVRHAAETKGVRLEAELDGAGLRVAGDPQRLEQIFTNLLGNAIKFTPPGGAIVVRVEPRGESQVEIRVTDTGRGIPAELLPHVFEPFTQGKVGGYGGLGLGLSIVHHLVTLHGGTISAESAGEGRGATFRVLLPLLLAGEA